MLFDLNIPHKPEKCKFFVKLAAGIHDTFIIPGDAGLLPNTAFRVLQYQSEKPL